MMKGCIWIVLLTLLLQGARAQKTEQFPKEPTAFLSAIQEMFDKISIKEHKDKCQEMFLVFTEMWNTGVFTQEIRDDMYDFSNQMLKRRLKAYPDFYHYYLSVIRLIKTNQPVNSYLAWHKSLTELIKNKSTTTPIKNFLEFSTDLFGDNILYKSPATTWKADNRDFFFKYDSVPSLVFRSLNLVCYANEDSAVIYKTKGIYYPLRLTWVGEGGSVYWKRAGFGENEVWAELDTYEIYLKFSKYSAEKVRFYHKKYFRQPLLGSLEEKVLADVREKNASYPFFRSYYAHLRIDSLFTNIDYEGGISMKGAKLIGTGNEEKDAALIFRKGNKIFARALSQEFIIRPGRISSSRASVSLYYQNDSIYHPGLELRYIDEDLELSLLRTGDDLAMSPFFDSYHAIDIYAEAIYWKMDEPFMSFGMIKGISGLGRADFYSINYFSAPAYDKLQGIDEVNPLILLRNCSEANKAKELSVGEIVYCARKPENQIISLLVNLATKGFLIYDPEQKKARLKNKVFDYINAYNKKIDYDVIRFKSETYARNNASLELDSFDLKLFGVPKVLLSDSQEVFLYPDAQQVILKGNRDFTFSGRIEAGLFDFYAKDCYFDYNQFKLEMPTIDSLTFKVKSYTLNEYNRRPLVQVKNVIQNLSGELLIDAPNNKSGLKDYPQYPIFSSTKNSFVFYDKPSIFNGVYTRDRFYFCVYPFTIDSLDNFSTEVLGFNGYLASAGIFQDIEETLKVQEDYSLGFLSSTPPAGYPAYKNKGVYYSKLKLSNKGLRGSGSLEYLTSTSWSDDFIFFPDSCNALAQNFMIREQTGSVEYPAVKGIEVKEHWMPYENRMIISMTNFPLSMYNNQSELYGALGLSPSILTGRGKMTFEEAEMDAELYRFKQHAFDSDTADFNLKTLDKSQLAFSTHNYRSNIDFRQRNGKFLSNGGISVAEFPANQYICYIDQFEWSMDQYEIAMGSDETIKQLAAYDRLTLAELVDMDLAGSEFVSVHPDQDSLRFVASKAIFNVKDNIIKAEDVKFIRVADAAVFPAKKEITISKDARINTLLDAKILANTVTKFHTIYDATVDIFSRRKYWGVGNYDYVDETGYKQRVQLGKISVDSSYQTIGRGHVSDSLGFTLSNDFDFMGEVTLLASREFLNFSGGFRIRHTCSSGQRSWVKFDSDINPKDILISVGDTILDIKKVRQEAALVYSNETGRYYSGFLAPKRDKNDKSMISAQGFLRFDKIAEDYEIASLEQLKRASLEGNRISLDRRHCILRCSGLLDLGVDLGMVKTKAYGLTTHYIVPDSTKVETVLIIDFPFDDKALELMTENIIGQNLVGVDLSKQVFQKALTDILGEREAEKMISDINLYNRLRRYPSELEHTLLFSEVKFKWDNVTRSYVSVGPIGLGSIGKVQINKYVDGYIEISKKKTGDVLNIYLEFDKGKHWYYFNYRNNLMQAISANTGFNDFIRDLKEDKRTVKGERGQEDYRFIPSNLIKKTDFLRRLKP